MAQFPFSCFEVNSIPSRCDQNLFQLPLRLAMIPSPAGRDNLLVQVKESDTSALSLKVQFQHCHLCSKGEQLERTLPYLRVLAVHMSNTPESSLSPCIVHTHT